MLETNKKYVKGRARDAQIIKDPWEHLIIEDFFPQELYNNVVDETAKILESYIKEENRRHRAPGEPTTKRGFKVLCNQSIGHLPDSETQPHLSQYYDILLDKGLQKIIKDKFSLREDRAKLL